ncbi:MAG TPA: LLM class F420-dependent oxidoreductase, partial [Mycobacterium sp.]
MSAPGTACSSASRRSKPTDQIGASRLELVDFRAFVEPQQGATYADQLAVARAAE